MAGRYEGTDGEERECGGLEIAVAGEERAQNREGTVPYAVAKAVGLSGKE